MSDVVRAAVHTEVLEALVVALKFDAGQFRSDISLAESGVDSLGLVEVVFVIEERFDISIPFNANEQSQAMSQSIGQLLNQVVDLVMMKRAAALQTASA